MTKGMRDTLTNLAGPTEAGCFAFPRRPLFILASCSGTPNLIPTLDVRCRRAPAPECSRKSRRNQSCSPARA